MKIEGNTAWIGGIYTQNANPESIGDEKIFAVRDNGQGPNGDPDQITYIWPAGPEGAQAFCDDPTDYAWVDVEEGQIRVKG